MDKDKIDIKSGRLFPWYFQLLGVVFLIIGLITFLDNQVISAALIVISLLIFSGYSGIEFRPAKGKYRPYNSLFFIKKGTTKNFQGVEKIFINASLMSQKLYAPRGSQSMTNTYDEYDAYIKFVDGTKEYLLSNRKKEKLISSLHPVAHALQADIVDYTENLN